MNCMNVMMIIMDKYCIGKQINCNKIKFQYGSAKQYESALLAWLHTHSSLILYQFYIISCVALCTWWCIFFVLGTTYYLCDSNLNCEIFPLQRISLQIRQHCMASVVVPYICCYFCKIISQDVLVCHWIMCAHGTIWSRVSLIVREQVNHVVFGRIITIT